MALGSNLRRLRKARGFTLRRLSELSGVEVGTLSAIEMRDSKRSEYAVPIAHALGVTVEELYGSVPEPPAAAVGGGRRLSPDEVRVLDLWATLLFDEQRDKVLALLKTEAEAARVAVAQLEKRGYHRATPDATVARHIKPAPRAAPLEPSTRPMTRKAAGPGDSAPTSVRAARGRREPRRSHHAAGTGRPRR